MCTIRPGGLQKCGKENWDEKMVFFYELKLVFCLRGAIPGDT